MAVGSLANRVAENGAVVNAAPNQELKASAVNLVGQDEKSRASVDQGVPQMTPEMLKECCVKNQGWLQPELNEFLMLQYKGFRHIENLQPYINVKTLWLECNGIARIDGLEAVPGLLALYLQSNVIHRIENLDCLTSLQTLNLSNNSITQVEGLANLHSLQIINLAGNKITDVACLQGFLERPSLTSVNVSKNYIEDGAAYLDFWEKAIPDVLLLYLQGNPCTRTLKDSRRRLVSNLKLLRWIDERPVDMLERAGAEAWLTGYCTLSQQLEDGSWKLKDGSSELADGSEAWLPGGKDAEMAAKRDHLLKEKAAKEREFANFKRMTEAGAARYRAQKEAQAARDSAQEDAVAQLEQTGSLSDGWLTSAATPSTSTSVSHAEPAQQSELHAKVQAFLKSRPEGDGDADAPKSEPLDNQTTPVDDLLDSELVPEPELDDAADTDAAEDSVDLLARMRASVPEDSEQTFVWTSFRAKRLGRLVAECRYDFKKVALRLSEEFSCAVDVDSCRQQYRKLMTPSENPNTDLTKGTGRARDGPDMDPAEVKEASEWWVRQVCRGQSEKRQGTSAALLKTKPPSASIGADDDLSGDEMNAQALAWAPSGDGFHTAESSVARPTDSGSMGSLLSGSEQLPLACPEFAPPPRAPPAEKPSETGLFDLD